MVKMKSTSVKMKTTSAMKDSGIEWIGKIPEHWEVIKGKYLFKQRTSKGNKDLILLSPTQKFGVIPQTLYEELSGMTSVKLDEKTDLNTLKTININDFCISLRSFQGGFEISRYNGVVSNAYQVFYAYKDIVNEYYKYMFKDKSFIDKVNSYTLSLRDGKNIAFSDFGNTYIPYPPIEEQQLIAVQLNQICKTLDNTKVDIEKQVEILNEYKKSVITEAVTKGLNKNVELKDSFSKFIEKIPKHWKLIKAKYIAKTIFRGNGITKEQVIENGNIQCIRYGEIYSKYDNAVEHCVSKTDLELINSPKYIQDGDILFAITGELVEEIGKNIIYLGNEPCIVGGDILVLRPEGNAKYLNYTLNCKSSQEQKSFGKAKLKVVHSSLSDIGNMYIPIPPIDEQEEIVAYLDSKCSEIDSIIETKKQQLELLEEYKKSIIYEYVTGKREVSAKPDTQAGDSHNE